MTSQQIKKRIDSILLYMADKWDFVNCHMVNYLTDKHWQNFVPEAVRHEIVTCDDVEASINREFFRVEGGAGYPAVAAFIKESEQHRLSGFGEVLTSRDTLNGILQRPRDDDTGTLSIKEFMNDKKKHEVEIFADIIDSLVRHHKADQKQRELFLVDAGDGKGYLSSRMALQYGYKVLGIDYKESNTENAMQRGKKLERVWPALSQKAINEKSPLDEKKKKVASVKPANGLSENYKTLSKFITPQLDIGEILCDTFAGESEESVYCLTGLHTCGNLASTCLRVFHTQGHCKILSNVGCCYHLLTEEFAGNELYGNAIATTPLPADNGFPLSQYLKERQVKIGRNARMLAAQSIERTVDGKELPQISLYYRALLEVLICQQFPELKNTAQVGKLKKYSNFREYLQLCEKRLQLNLNTDDLEDFERLYAGDRKYLELFYLLRMTFAPVLESLILLDRLLYLKELNYEHSYLISLFDPVISPRNVAIIAWKAN